MNRLLAALNHVPKTGLGVFPTPLHRLKNLERDLNFQEIFIKRDDLNGLGPGGNKVRSLEFILGEAVSLGSDTVIVCGPLQSNLCTLTACACAKLGLKCITMHNAEPPEEFEGNLLLNALLNVESLYVGAVSAEERNRYALELTERLKAEGKKPYIVENGGTSGVGALGYVAGCLELAGQVKERNLPVKTLFAPGGNGGVAAGLIYGNVLLGRPFEIVIISVEYDSRTLANEIKKTIAQAEKVLGLPFNHQLEDVCRLVDDYRGQGWGINTVESESFVHRLPQLEGIFIENIYTSKVLVGLEDFVTQGYVKDGICYLHTGGIGSLFSQY
jgi:1-aminocyclopropane-1-carboxylate deaminase/D-cysteine desulfhydrase-like pyridoxal-dependent ACC family enzyme